MSGPNGANSVIPCASCGGGLDAVVDSRPHEVMGMPVVKRRRRCLACGSRQTTYEVSGAMIEEIEERQKKAKDIFARLADALT